MTATASLFAAANFNKVRLAPQDAEPLPHWAYTSPVWYEREVERIFRKAWNYVGHVSQLPEPGSFLTVEIAGVPLIVVKGQDGQVRAFFNSCRHRGSRLLWGEGNCKLIRCPYHAWAYDLAGSLVATPLVDEDMEGKKRELSLHPVRLERRRRLPVRCTRQHATASRGGFRQPVEGMGGLRSGKPRVHPAQVAGT